MSAKLMVKPLGWCARLADALTAPIMCVLAGTFRETPQGTHFWNNTKLTHSEIEPFNRKMMLDCEGIADAGKRRFLGLPVFHIPILGGWRNYAVVMPAEGDDVLWHAGWIAGDSTIGVSRILLGGPVRLLLGPDAVSFFGVRSKADGGDQLELRLLAVGRVGDGGPYRYAPLS